MEGVGRHYFERGRRPATRVTDRASSPTEVTALPGSHLCDPHTPRVFAGERTALRTGKSLYRVLPNND